MWVNSEIARMSQASIHGLYHAVVFLCVRDRLRVKPQGDGEYQRGVWNAESSPDCVHTHSHSHTHTHTQRYTYTDRKRTLWQNKAVFWWVPMNALPHTSNPKLTEPTSRPSNQLPTLPVFTLLKLSTDFFFYSGNRSMIMFSKDYQDLLLMWLPVLKSFQSDTAALRLGLCPSVCSAWMAWLCWPCTCTGVFLPLKEQ